uniref:Putative secreted protein n=1 Tax=Anopheles darlingi TaxID=43151 RepID=A0A2M4D4B3_ANODA
MHCTFARFVFLVVRCPFLSSKKPRILLPPVSPSSLYIQQHCYTGGLTWHEERYARSSGRQRFRRHRPSYSSFFSKPV